MEKNNMRRNCPEVENLMDGKMPFVIRCGITFVELRLLFIAGLLLLSEGAAQQLMKGNAEHTIRNITERL